MNRFNLPYGNSVGWILVFGLLALFLPVFLIEADVLRYTNGVFMYPLDDTFIHLEIAENLSKGNWGVNDHEFASASSSLLYTVLLTTGRAFSDHTAVPFIINCIAGTLIVIALHLWLKQHGVSAIAQVLIIWLAVFVTPLPTMVISGMEHTIQCLVSFLFIFHFSDWLEKSKENQTQRLPYSLLFYSVLVTSVRYEGLFLIAIACVMLLFYKRIKAAFVLGFIAILPVVIFGLFSVSKGSYFLPNSVLVKSATSTSGIVGFISNILLEKLMFAKSGMAALATQRWAIILPLLYLLFRRRLRLSYSFILIFLIAATILQLSLASTGWLYRYEAYLFFCSIVLTSILFYKYGEEALANYSVRLHILTFLLAFFLFFPVVLRSITALAKVDRACKNIYDQQYQMAQFSKKYYYNSPIAANDIGAISYFTNGSILDLWGLASIEVTKSRENKYWTPEFLDSMCRSREVKLIMVYDSWFNDSLTSRWKKVTTWQIQDNVICGDDIVSFYSIDNTDKNYLYKSLKEYQSFLPSSVRVKYYY
jgi:hypothetical protein